MRCRTPWAAIFSFSTVGDVDWAEIAEPCADAYRAIAPARLAALLDG